jgi:hypothetical protein
VRNGKVGTITGVLGTKATTARTLVTAIVAKGMRGITAIPLATSVADTKTGITNLGQGTERTVGDGAGSVVGEISIIACSSSGLRAR